jgi:hypothetical protein
MTISRFFRCSAALACALALLLQGSPSAAGGQGNNSNNNPISFKFIKWPLPAGAMGGFVAGDPTIPFIGFLFASNASTVGSKVRRLEAMYEVVAGDDSFAAMMRGSQSLSGLGLLDGVIVTGWRIGAPVHAEFQQTTPAEGNCIGAPATATLCWEGTMHIGRAPTRNN